MALCGAGLRFSTRDHQAGKGGRSGVCGVEAQGGDREEESVDEVHECGVGVNAVRLSRFVEGEL